MNTITGVKFFNHLATTTNIFTVDTMTHNVSSTTFYLSNTLVVSWKSPSGATYPAAIGGVSRGPRWSNGINWSSTYT